jgi:hypothetical protein
MKSLRFYVCNRTINRDYRTYQRGGDFSPVILTSHFGPFISQLSPTNLTMERAIAGKHAAEWQRLVKINEGFRVCLLPPAQPPGTPVVRLVGSYGVHSREQLDEHHTRHESAHVRPERHAAARLADARQ